MKKQLNAKRKTSPTNARHRGQVAHNPITTDWSFCDYYIPDEQAALATKPARRGIFGRQ